MHRYVIKNTEDYTIVLKATDGTEYRLKPDSYISYQTSEEGLVPVLTHLYQRGSIDYWRIEIQEVDTEKVEWQKEGF